MTDNDTYAVEELYVEINNLLTEEQFREIEAILERQPQRFKKWANFFVFDLDPEQPFVSTMLAEYLREQGLAHAFHRTERWND